MSSKGFTLVEMMVSTFVIGILVVMMGTFFSYFLSNYSFTYDQGRTIANAQTTLTMLSAELRNSRTSQDGAYILEIAGDQEIVFYTDLEGDNKVERVRYFLNNGNLYRGQVNPGNYPNLYDLTTENVRIVGEYVQNLTTPVFYYYNQDWPGDVTNNPLVPSQRLLNTRMIKMNLLINVNPLKQSNYQIQTEVMLRNLKDT